MQADCLDRACQWQEIGPHFAHNKDADFLAIEIDSRVAIRKIEGLKAERGRRCFECARWLIPTDEDHSFCNDCWAILMYHPFNDDGDGFCKQCGESKEFFDHKKPEVSR